MTHTAFRTHDHAGCASAALRDAERLAAARGLNLTPVRRKTLEILLGGHRAMGAYDVLDRLAEAGFGHQPPVAYRALDWLVDHGLAHRVRRLNAFTACAHPGEDHAPAFFICDGCGALAEAPAAPVRDAIGQAAAEIGFAVGRTSIEVAGTCPACRDTA